VRILVDYQTEDGVCCNYATTLGAGGLFIETDEPLPPQTGIKLRFRLPHSEELHEVEGCVSWRRDASGGDPAHAPGMGVQFRDGPAQAKLARELDHI
jgi:uncharacterized protein (TIGR02266 family)